jgi:hypothetical protein
MRVDARLSFVPPSPATGPGSAASGTPSSSFAEMLAGANVVAPATVVKSAVVARTPPDGEVGARLRPWTAAGGAVGSAPTTLAQGATSLEVSTAKPVTGDGARDLSPTPGGRFLVNVLSARPPGAPLPQAVSHADTPLPISAVPSRVSKPATAAPAPARYAPATAPPRGQGVVTRPDAGEGGAPTVVLKASDIASPTAAPADAPPAIAGSPILLSPLAVVPTWAAPLADDPTPPQPAPTKLTITPPGGATDERLRETDFLSQPAAAPTSPANHTMSASVRPAEPFNPPSAGPTRALAPANSTRSDYAVVASPEGGRSMVPLRAFALDEFGMFGLRAPPWVTSVVGEQPAPSGTDRTSGAIAAASVGTLPPPAAPGAPASPTGAPDSSDIAASAMAPVASPAASAGGMRTHSPPVLPPALANEPEAQTGAADEESSATTESESWAASAPAHARAEAPPKSDVSLVVADNNGQVQVVAGAPPLNAEAAARLRRLIDATAAEYGKKLLSVTLNGNAVEASGSPEGASRWR